MTDEQETNHAFARSRSNVGLAVKTMEEDMSNIERLKQYLWKASFSSEADRFSALECVEEIVRERELLIENIEIAAEEWARYVEADTAPVTLPKYISAAITKTAND